MRRLTLQQKRAIIRATTIFGIIFVIVGSYVIAQSSFFKPGGGFNQLLKSLGIWAPLIFIILQISQCVYPLIPFGLTNVIGNLVFGTWLGFIYNCIGMLIGSSINFFLGKRFGASIIKAFISDEQYEKYVGKISDTRSFSNLLRVGFFLPVFPDDIFCMIAGLSQLTYWQFMRLVVAYRPISVFVFTYAWAEIIQFVARWIGG